MGVAFGKRGKSLNANAADRGIGFLLQISYTKRIMTASQRFQLYFLVSVLLLTLAFSLWVVFPYLQGLFVAAALAVVVRPFYRMAAEAFGGYESIAAFCCVIVILVLLLAPLAFFGLQIAKEARDLYEVLSRNGTGFVFAPPVIFGRDTTLFFPQLTEILNIQEGVRRLAGFLADNFSAIFSSTIHVFANLFVGLFALYYLLRDGSKVVGALIELSPLDDEYDREIVRRLEVAVNSVVKGTLVIALIQGLLTGLGFWMFGVPNPTLWGSVAAVAALIPGVGTSLVLAPAIIYLFAIGHTAQGAALLVWGMIAVGLIDQFLGPKLVERGINIHPLLIIVSVLSGLEFFGPLGFLLGPLLLSFLFALFHIYREFMREEVRA